MSEKTVKDGTALFEEYSGKNEPKEDSTTAAGRDLYESYINRKPTKENRS